MPLLPRLDLLVCCLAALCPAASAQTPPAPPEPDARYQNWLYRTPDSTQWKRTEKDGNLVFAIDEPPGDFCAITLFADAKAGPDFSAQFAAAIAADQQAKDTVKIEADTGPKAGKSTEGDDVLTRNLRSETHALHTFHYYVASHSGEHFDLAAFQTTSETSWARYGAAASQFIQSLTAVSSTSSEEVARLVGSALAETAPPPMLPGLGDTAAAAPAPIPLPPTPRASAAPTNPHFPQDPSALVVKAAVNQKNGKPIDGIKLSQHDTEITSPSLIVAADGVIHVAFVEKHRTTFALAVYHRSSRDSGKTWSEAENLSEDMPSLNVGLCYALSDGQGRIYVIWRAGPVLYSPASPNPSNGQPCNLMYRVLTNGTWSKIIPVHPPVAQANISDGSLSYFATTDAAGHIQVIWNVTPDTWHRELTVSSGPYHQHLAGIGNGLVFQATLNGTAPTAPREIFLSPVAGQGGQGGYGAYCDGLDAINGYADAAGSADFVGIVTRTHDYTLNDKAWYELVENGRSSPLIALPPLSFHGWRDVPTLLVDAAGKRHVIELYLAGERPKIRDRVFGSEDDPATIRAAAPVTGSILGFQAWQGPNGRMIVVMQMSENGIRDHGDSWVSISRGQGWSPPINVTNNVGRATFASKQNGASSVVVVKNYSPGPAAAAYDRSGHLLLLMINFENGVFGVSALGVQLVGGSSSTPTLQFLRF